jgi:hypothetical protein
MATVRELMDLGYSAYVFNLRRNGVSEANIIRRIIQREPGTSWSAAQAAYNRALKAEQAGAQLRIAAPTYRLTGADLPAQDRGRTGWRYYVVLEVLDPNTGQTYTRRTYVQSANSLTRAEVEADALAQLQIASTTGRAGRFSRPIQSASPLANAYLLTAERF